MDTVHIELPAALLKTANLQESELPQEAARLLALELYRECKVSLARAAELSRTPLAAFMDFAAKHEVPPLQFGVEELEDQRRSSDSFGT